MRSEASKEQQRLCSRRYYHSHKAERNLKQKAWVAANRSHLRIYSRERYRRAWGITNRTIAKEAEIFATEKLLPALGFSEIDLVSILRRFLPFDIVATHNGSRVLIDVTTGQAKWRHGLVDAYKLAEALRMEYYILFVKPDFTRYVLKQSNGKNNYWTSLAELKETDSVVHV